MTNNNIAYSKGIGNTVGWNDPTGFYVELGELNTQMLNSRINQDISSMLLIFDEILIKVMPYILSNMISGKHKQWESAEDAWAYFADKEDINTIQSQIKEEKTDHMKNINSGIRAEIDNILTVKRMKLSFYMALAGLGLPMNHKRPIESAILGLR